MKTRKEVAIKQVENGYITEMRLYKYAVDRRGPGVTSSWHQAEYHELVHSSAGDLVTCLEKFLTDEPGEKK